MIHIFILIRQIARDIRYFRMKNSIIIERENMLKKKNFILVSNVIIKKNTTAVSAYLLTKKISSKRKPKSMKKNAKRTWRRKWKNSEMKWIKEKIKKLMMRMRGSSGDTCKIRLILIKKIGRIVLKTRIRCCLMRNGAKIQKRNHSNSYYRRAWSHSGIKKSKELKWEV